LQVFCKSTNGNAEVRCCICDQGFVLFWDRQPLKERSAVMSEIQVTLRRQHRTGNGTQAHPQEGFLAPQWSRSNESAAASSVAKISSPVVLDLWEPTNKTSST
jgi:hypothetical protein